MADLYPGFMAERPTDDARPLPYRPPSQRPLPAWFDAAAWPHLADPALLGAVYACQRCGTCLTTADCTAMLGGDGAEAYTPRGRIGVIRALLEGRLAPAGLPERVIEAVNLCSYCNNCAHVCMVNTAWVEGLAGEPNIPSADLFHALRLSLLDRGVRGVR